MTETARRVLENVVGANLQSTLEFGKTISGSELLNHAESSQNATKVDCGPKQPRTRLGLRPDHFELSIGFHSQVDELLGHVHIQSLPHGRSRRHSAWSRHGRCVGAYCPVVPSASETLLGGAASRRGTDDKSPTKRGTVDRERLRFVARLSAAATALLLIPAACSRESSPTTTVEGPVIVSIYSFKYDPDPVTVTVGDSVTWTNDDPVPHTATAVDDSFDTKLFLPGKSVTLTFATVGTFRYFCGTHPEMVGTVIVAPVPAE